VVHHVYSDLLWGILDGFLVAIFASGKMRWSGLHFGHLGGMQ
jgi:hypothetical protein